ncbi:methyltransferase domain-containing protein [Chryseolinea sp. H1M3-3]|uniref:methyltransferase domain-containing protein n=1 Tax=Chryseolinea sp. H1M3-3 TaxID=3034144 RepID=UPI0023EDD24A|nr:methyltransferase domain-containing protein [Chryseolinea sp. H1M3-3]
MYQFIFKHVKEYNTAWDCATGNGQVAQYLARYFEQVLATDISQQQLDHAALSDNIIYSVSSAEQTSFKDNQFDLITVAQALHWFDANKFYYEATRVGKPGSLIAVWGYGMLNIESRIDAMFRSFYSDTVGPYWDDARRLVEQGYKTISFPFEEISAPEFFIEVQWTLEQLSGYLSSWSATQKYIKEKGHDPVTPFIQKLQKHWPSAVMKVSFPVFLRIGRIIK